MEGDQNQQGLYLINLYVVLCTGFKELDAILISKCLPLRVGHSPFALFHVALVANQYLPKLHKIA